MSKPEAGADHPEAWLYVVQFGSLAVGLGIWVVVSIGFSSPQCTDLPPEPSGILGVILGHVRCQPAAFVVFGFGSGYLTSIAGVLALEAIDRRTVSGSQRRRFGRAAVNVAATAIPFLTLLTTWKLVFP